MTCCDNQTSKPIKIAICPANGKAYREVPLQTVLHHARKPWERTLPMQSYYFCTDPECEIVYFGDNNTYLTRREVREEIGQKSSSSQRTICYCFDITLTDIKLHPEQSRQFVIEQTKQSQCMCEVRNPSGKCCLKDFPKQ